MCHAPRGCVLCGTMILKGLHCVVTDFTRSAPPLLFFLSTPDAHVCLFPNLFASSIIVSSLRRLLPIVFFVRRTRWLLCKLTCHWQYHEILSKKYYTGSVSTSYIPTNEQRKFETFLFSTMTVLWTEILECMREMLWLHFTGKCNYTAVMRFMINYVGL